MEASCDRSAPDNVIVDPVHGNIHLSDLELSIIDTGVFQRLRRIKQLGMAQVTYPNATHTRFSHSLGVLAIMTRLLQAPGARRLGFSNQIKENLRLAALLHDVGHYPYSHLMEKAMDEVLTEEKLKPGARAPLAGSYPSHVTVGMAIVNQHPELRNILRDEKRADLIAKLIGSRIRPGDQLSNLIHSTLDLDRLDYLQRDAQATGVPYGLIDLNYLLRNIRVSPSGQVGLNEKAMPAAEHFLFAR